MRLYSFKTFALGCWLFVAMMAIAMAQGTNFAVPSLVDTTGPTGIPQSTDQLFALLIPIVTTGIVFLFGKIPQLPRPFLPVLTPFVGILVGLVMNSLTSLHLGPAQMAFAGTVAVFLRETTNQLVTKQLKPLEESKTDTKPVDGAVATKDPQA